MYYILSHVESIGVLQVRLAFLDKTITQLGTEISIRVIDLFGKRRCEHPEFDM